LTLSCVGVLDDVNAELFFLTSHRRKSPYDFLVFLSCRFPIPLFFSPSAFSPPCLSEKHPHSVSFFSPKMPCRRSPPFESHPNVTPLFSRLVACPRPLVPLSFFSLFFALLLRVFPVHLTPNLVPVSLSIFLPVATLAHSLCISFFMETSRFPAC